ncbi:uncharacterized protein LOC109708769 [Ananas comosus]|uniref:Uncharacterized protein LOC109708769 n=1 Tax=Ananas comosus TaxID=4615 RepID=A0A6P5EYG0_ANACO|nr:uncharacterized protein LOC109708769 [Ananas comosus]
MDTYLVDFWSHKWCGEISLQSLLPELFNKVELKVCNVKDCFSTNGWRWRWRKILKGTESESQRLGWAIQAFNELLSNFHTVNSRDNLCWRWNKGQGFIVKSVYEMFNDRGVKDDLPAKIWRLRVPKKVKIFIWLVLKKRIPTIDNLNKRGWTGNQSCVLCACAQETVDHLLLTIVFSRFLMTRTFDEAMDVQFDDDIRGFWEKEMERGNGQAAVKRQCSLAAIWWVLWRQRNNVIFKN